MKALVYTGPHALAFRDEPAPTPAPGEALVRVAAVGICGSDMHAYHGFDTRRPPPLILGHEAAGVVVSGPRQGARVAVNPLVVDPESPEARQGRPHLSATRQIISMPPRPGAFAELVRVPESNLFAIPDHLGFAEAALAEPIAVSYHAVGRGAALLGVPLAEVRAVVLGGGAIGLAAALCLRLLGAGSIMVGETQDARRAMLRDAAGFAAFAPGAAAEPAENAVDLVIDAVGAAATRAAACRMVRPGGVIIHAGLLPGHEGLDVRKITLQEITFTGTYCYTPAEFAAVIAALGGRRFGALDWLETRPLHAGAEAFADIDAGRVGAAKIVLIPS